MEGAGEEYPTEMEKNQRQEEVGAQGEPQGPFLRVAGPERTLTHSIFPGDI